ncbi:hypothetical protein U9M48_000231 [Paspalum notatum var. saurae]|uniref:Xylanase inhibitor C-terminal domain-containing protein n=1 Tax=Paspalum notatum var. saurae TaxID=547442 RepID=A0AAQ3PEK9_PASNO
MHRQTTLKNLPNFGEYLMTLAIGTPPLTTYSAIVWTKRVLCQPVLRSSSQVRGPESETFSSARRRSIRPASIALLSTAATQATPTLTAPRTASSGWPRGAWHSSLGSGAPSSPTACSRRSRTPSALLLGPSAVINDTGVRTTPFVASPAMAPMDTYYYINLTGISLATMPLSIPHGAFSLNADDGGGLIVDSGTTITSLVDVDAAYQHVRATVVSLPRGR